MIDHPAHVDPGYQAVLYYVLQQADWKVLRTFAIQNRAVPACASDRLPARFWETLLHTLICGHDDLRPLHARSMSWLRRHGY